MKRKRLLEEILREDDDIEIEEEKPKKLYRHYLRTPFPKVQRNLPIVAEDFCYTMNIMFMRPNVAEILNGILKKGRQQLVGLILLGLVH